jgi:hypothetical protein
MDKNTKQDLSTIPTKRFTIQIAGGNILIDFGQELRGLVVDAGEARNLANLLISYAGKLAPISRKRHK